MSRIYNPDQELIDRLLVNDTDAFEELYRRYWYSLYNYSYKKLRSTQDARKIVRDIFIELWENRATWPGDFSVSRHLYSAVRKSVVETLNARLADDGDEEILPSEVLDGFSTASLQQAKAPSIRIYEKENPSALQRQNTLAEPEKNGIYLNMRWLIQALSSKTYS
jgi:RNA polymerase sigma-19 factor, ECF subfamily